MNALEWNEPKRYQRACYLESPQASLREGLKFAAVVFAVVLKLRLLSGFGNANPNLPGWPVTALIAAAFGLFLAFVFPLLLSLVTLSVINISERGVGRRAVSHGVTVYFWSWDDIAECELTTRALGRRAYPVLNLIDAQQQIVASLGLTNRPTRAEIFEYLANLGMPVVNSEMPAS